MRLIIAQYLQTLKEREEFDSLLPDVLLAMGYVPISKPQTGVRQYGVDLAVLGISPEDGVKELLLLVIKRGDITRNNWNSGPQSVRQSMDEIFDVYLKTHIDPQHESLRKKIVLATTGDMKQEIQINWDNYLKGYSSQAIIEFWGGDKIAMYIEKYMLDEHIFNTEDRTNLRKALALAGEIEYDHNDLHRLFQRQLGLSAKGELMDLSVSPRDLLKSLRVINLSTQVFSRWSEDEGNLKQALIAVERAMLWSWHRIQLEEPDDRLKYFKEFGELWGSYNIIAHRYFEKLQPHLYVQDGLSGYCQENSMFSLIVFEQVGILAVIGLCRLLANAGDDEIRKVEFDNAVVVGDALAALLINNPVSGSPRFDNNVVEIVLGMLLLVLTGHISQAQSWLGEMVKRIDYTLKIKRDFPICTDSTDDLVEMIVSGDEALSAQLMRMSWLLPTLAGWSVVLGRYDLYEVLSKNSKKDYSNICLQLWHPTTQDISKNLYFWPAHNHCGESEAPIILPESANEYRTQMEALLQSERHNIIDSSTAGMAGVPAIDLVACRHFRTPVAPFFWYKFVRSKGPNSKNNEEHC